MTKRESRSFGFSSAVSPRRVVHGSLSCSGQTDRLVGKAGTSREIRLVQGARAEAEAFFEQLTKGGTAVEGSSFPGRLVELPGGGRVGFRPKSKSGPPTIDVFVKGIGIRKIKFDR